MIREKEDFRDVIWTDESTVMFDPYSHKCYRKEGKTRKLKARPKHPAKIHVWGDITERGNANPHVLRDNDFHKVCGNPGSWVGAIYPTGLSRDGETVTVGHEYSVEWGKSKKLYGGEILGVGK